MPRSFPSAAVMAALLWLAACVPESVHPLSDPEGAPPDPRLTGLWSGQMEDETAFFHFLPKDAAVLEIVSVTHKGDSGGEWLVFSGFPGRVGEAWYMNVKFLAESGEAADPADQNFILCRYEITGDDVLTVWMMAADAVAEDIAGGKVEGVVEEGSWVNTVRITADSDGLTDYVRRSDPARLFAVHFGTFRRVR